jgi:hypothetical protein
MDTSSSDNQSSNTIEKELPRPPRWTKAIGVGIVVMGMAMGTGELIMWPHLITKHGLGILWLALVGITLQYFINQEVARHALATGESFFAMSGKIIRWSPLFWLGAAVLLYIWPAWASALGTILRELFGFGEYIVWALISLALLLILTFLGKVAYRMLEGTLKIIVPLFIALLVAVSFLNLSFKDIGDAFAGLLNFGHIPEGVDIAVLLGAVVLAGAGGMLNLCVSLWYRDKDAGMGAYVESITNPVTGRPISTAISSYSFALTQENMDRWKGWMRYVRIDQGVIFWLLGVISIVLLGTNAFAVLVPQGLVPEGAQVAVLQAQIFGSQWGIWGERLYLVMAYLMLFSVMWTVLDALTRIITDIVHTNAHIGPQRKFFKAFGRYSVHKLYYVLIVVVVVIQAILLPFNQPLGFLVISSVLGGLAMALYTPLLFYISNFKLPKGVRPGIITNVILAAAAVFYTYFVIRIVVGYF